MTSGSSFKSNERCEAETGVIKKSIRVLISAGTCTLRSWPLGASHLGDRRLRSQLGLLGWPTGRLLRFGAKAYAVRKSWQARYMPHGKRSGKGYCVCSTSTGRCFFPTDDIIIPETLQPGVEDQVLYLPGRDAEAAIHKRRNNQQFRCFSSRGGPRSSPGTLKCLNHGTT